MNIKYIILLLVVLLFLSKIIYDNMKLNKKHTNTNTTTNTNTNISTIEGDDEIFYINPYLMSNEPSVNVIKKYNDSKINIINNMNPNNKNIYDSNISSSLNSNSNKNNLIHFIDFLI